MASRRKLKKSYKKIIQYTESFKPFSDAKAVFSGKLPLCTINGKLYCFKKKKFVDPQRVRFQRVVLGDIKNYHELVTKKQGLFFDIWFHRIKLMQIVDNRNLKTIFYNTEGTHE